MSNYAVQWLEGSEAQAGLGHYQTAGLKSVFQFPGLIEAWVDTKGRALGLDFALATLRSSCALVYLPLALRRQYGLRRAVGIGEPHFDYQAPIEVCGSPDWAAFWSEMWHPLAKRGRLTDLSLRRLPISICGAEAATDDATETALLDLDGLTELEAFLASRSANLRSDVRRRLRRAAESGGFRLHVFGKEDVAGAKAALVEMRSAYEDLHQNEPSGALFRQPGTWDFYQAMIVRLLPLGIVHFSVLYVNERAAAWHFGFCFGGVLHWYKPTYATWAAPLSPGKILLAELVELGIRAKLKAIDFGGGLEPYKRQWGNRFEALKCYEFHDKGIGGSALRLGRAFRSMLGRGPRE